MRCKDILPLLSGYLDQELSVDEIRKVAAHLESCRSCEAALNEIGKTQSLLRDLRPMKPRSDFWMDAYSGIAGETPRPVAWWQRLTQAQRSAMVLAPALVGAAMAVLLQLQPIPAPRVSYQPVDHVDELVQAHLEARTSQPLADQGVVRMLLVNAQSESGPLGN